MCQEVITSSVLSCTTSAILSCAGPKMSYENTSPAIISFHNAKGTEAGRQVGQEILPSGRDHSCPGALQATSAPPTLNSFCVEAAKFPDVTTCSSLTGFLVRVINNDKCCNLPPEKTSSKLLSKA